MDTKVKHQIEILIKSIKLGIPLAAYLRYKGLSYDDLIYQNHAIPSYIKSPYINLVDFSHNKNNIPVVSFFSGAGGLDLGFETAGFEHLALFEINDLFCTTIKHNRPSWNISVADISQTDAMIKLIRKKTSNTNHFDGVFIGGPPCQPFSIASNQRFSKNGDNFKRIGFAHETNGNLLFKYIELIIHFKPTVFLIENVPGLIDVDGGRQLSKAFMLLNKNGYNIEKPILLRADSFKVPQQRIRLFIVGSRTKKPFKPPKATEHRVNVGAVFDANLKNISNHITREHNAESILRYMELNYGQRDHLGRVDRLDPSVPSKTVIAGGTSGGGRSHLHPYVPRTLSVRECARIQTFPDDFMFLGPVARQFTQVGNAVPPVLGAQIAHSIYNSFFN